MKADVIEIALKVAIAHSYYVISSLVASACDTLDPAFLHIFKARERECFFKEGYII